MSKRTSSLAAPALIALGGVLLPASSLEAQAPDTSYIEVSGTARVAATPDRAALSLVVVTEAGNAREAAEANAERMDRVIRSLRESEVAGLRIETFGYSLNPRYNRPTNGSAPRIVGYQAMNNVRVITLDLDRVGELIDLGIGSGANRVAGLSFDVSDPEPVRMAALGDAVRNAREQAEVIATALGVVLGHPLEVRGNAQVPSPVYMRADFESMASFAAPPTPIEPGEQQISASVTVRFRILPN